jgi:restriction system protein
MVRAGKSGRFFEEFREQSLVGIGWKSVGDLSTIKNREQVAKTVATVFSSQSSQAVSMAAGQLYRFAKEFQIGDRVVTYDPRARRYLCGTIAGPYRYDPGQDNEELLNTRATKWDFEVSRDNLSDVAKYSLGALSTIFSIPIQTSEELWGERKPDAVLTAITASDTEAEAASGLYTGTPAEQIMALSNEAVKDRIARIDWDDMQELVAGLLRAMGYKTVVSPAGSDRGKDIVACPDGFGFQEPRIIVEVKHRPGQRIGSSDIRSFLGGRHPRDRGLYVSTGGFTQEAYYEADRASIPLTLLDFERLVNAITEHYDRLDEETRQIIPLKRMYWPVNP